MLNKILATSNLGLKIRDLSLSRLYQTNNINTKSTETKINLSQNHMTIAWKSRGYNLNIYSLTTSDIWKNSQHEFIPNVGGTYNEINFISFYTITSASSSSTPSEIHEIKCLKIISFYSSYLSLLLFP